MLLRSQSVPEEDMPSKPRPRRRTTSQGDLQSLGDLEAWDSGPVSILRRSSLPTELKKRVSFYLPDDKNDDGDFGNDRIDHLCYQELQDDTDSSDDEHLNKNRSFQEVQDDINAVLDFL